MVRAEAVSPTRLQRGWRSPGTSVVLAALATMACGCAPCEPLAQTPVVDAPTPSARSAVQHELEAFASAQAAPTCVARIQFRDLDRGGRYNTASRVITLQPGLDDLTLRRATRHELCHAIERQNKLVRGPGSVFDQRLWEVGRHGVFPARLEAFAQVCEAGPASLKALWPSTCPRDPRLLDREVAVRDDAFGGPTVPAPEWRLAWMGTAPMPPPDGVRTLDETLADGLDADALWIWSNGQSYPLDPDTGWSPSSPSAPLTSCDVTPPLPWQAQRPGLCDERGQPLAVVATLHGAQRLLLRDAGGAWAGARHCPGENAALATTVDGLGWLVEGHERGVAWHQLVVRGDAPER